ncbi:MAG: hypothetical protein HDR05_02455 [Lachnospiraceae bacterium]|nr:hypothetical protein [Lachnospiraceae bacterium]
MKLRSTDLAEDLGTGGKILEKLSKEISYALSHAPWKYELEMDEEGWVPIAQLLDALHRSEKWKNISGSDLKEMIEKSEKKRHEIAKRFLESISENGLLPQSRQYVHLSQDIETAEKVWLADIIATLSLEK